MKYEPSSVCRIGGLSCMGCCGHDFTSREEVEDAIRRNTIRYKASSHKLSFMNKSDFVRECGVCFNVIFFDDGSVGCPLHPKQNEGKDLREGYCEIDHLCKAAFLFRKWDDERREQFVNFVLAKKLDWWEFSMGMDNNSLVNEFEKEFGTTIEWSK